MTERRQVLLSGDQIARALSRMAAELAERNRGTELVALVGIRRGGVPLAERLRRLLRELEAKDVPVGSVDITLYRDDASTSPPNPRIGRSELAFPLEDRTVVLVDDVVFTGRTTRAAIDALLDYGRPRAIQLAALVDRGHRELPIQPDYVGRALTTSRDERVEVLLDRGGGLPDEVAVLRRDGAPT
jgi:pyrimidine operon attenuation protein/uracil phosphoribosyltransferase